MGTSIVRAWVLFRERGGCRKSMDIVRACEPRLGK